MRLFPVPSRSIARALALMLFGVQSAQAVTFSVGPEAGCTHATVQAAIDAVPASGVNLVRVAAQTYTAQAITINGKFVTLAGGFADCAQTTATGTTILSGAGGGQDSVVTVLGNSDVTLENLSIIRGDEVFDGFGGGVDFRGHGVLYLRKVGVSQNYAGFGGGINVSATGGAAQLWIEADTSIVNNVAQFSGGGIRLASTSRLFMLEENTAVIGNEALGIDPFTQALTFGFGGGIEVIGPARADIGSPGLGNNGAIFNNTAQYGGGIAVIGADSSQDLDAEVRLFSTDPTRPVRVHGNRALQTGGGIHLDPDAGLDNISEASLCAFDFRIDDNRAQNGSAIYADTDFNGIAIQHGSDVWLNTMDCGPEPRADFGAVSCAPGTVCNTIDGNANQNSIGQGVAGTTIMIQSNSELDASRVALRGNQGSRILQVMPNTDTAGVGNTLAKLRNCLIADNVLAGEVVLSDEENTTVHLESCTLAGNVIGGATVLAAADALILRRSILWQPGKQSVQANGGTSDIVEVIASELATLGGASFSVLQADPRFFDPAHGEYQLQAASPAVDFSATSSGPDLDGRSRNVQLAVVPDRFGPGDLGAFERQEVGNLVRNGDFGVDLRLWSPGAPGVATWQSAGANSAGSVFVSITPQQQEVIGLVQCVRIPGPGPYRLTGFAHGVGFGLTRDGVSLRWRYLPSTTGETCNGAVTNTGNLFFPGSSAFVAPAAPAIIDEPPSGWTRFTAVELSLVVREGGLTAGSTSGFFDGIVLESAAAPVLEPLLVDGFE